VLRGDPCHHDRRDSRRSPRHLRHQKRQQPAGDRGDCPRRLDYLLLADSFLVLDQLCGGAQVVTDEREVATRRICSAPP
jgi:hypothetical protein